MNCKQKLLSVLLIVSFFIFLCGIELQLGIMGNRVFKSSLRESHYIIESGKTFVKEVQNIVSESGFPLEFVQKVLDENRLYMGVSANIERILKQEEIRNEVDQFELDLKNAIYEYVEVTGQRQNQKKITAIDPLLAKAREAYQKYYSLDFVKKFYNQITSWAIFLKIAIAISIAIFIGISTYLFYITKHRSSAIKYMMVSTATSSVLTLLSIFLIKRISVLHTLDVYNEAYAHFLEIYTSNIVTQYVIIFVACIIGILILYFVYRYLRKEAYIKDGCAHGKK